MVEQKMEENSCFFKPRFLPKPGPHNRIFKLVNDKKKFALGPDPDPASAKT
jgi:hypothetical protein